MNPRSCLFLLCAHCSPVLYLFILLPVGAWAGGCCSEQISESSAHVAQGLAFPPGCPALVRPALSSIRTAFFVLLDTCTRAAGEPYSRGLACHCVQPLLRKRLTTLLIGEQGKHAWVASGQPTSPSGLASQPESLAPSPDPCPANCTLLGRALSAFPQTVCPLAQGVAYLEFP